MTGAQTGDHEDEMEPSELGPLFCDSWGKHRNRLPPCTAFGLPLNRWILVHVSVGSHGTALVPWAFFAMDYPGIRT